MRTLLILVLSLGWTSLGSADEYVLIDVKINDQPVRLSFDTGAEYTALFERAAARLNLEVSHPPGNPKLKAGRIPLSMTEPCSFTLGDITKTWRLAVLKLPDHIRPEFDGVLAWSSVRHGILRIDATAKQVGPRKDLPGDIDRWSQWQIDPQSRLLTVKVPQPSDPNAILFIDTGNPFGVDLNAARWNDWCAKHPDRPTTLCANYSPDHNVVHHIHHPSFLDFCMT